VAHWRGTDHRLRITALKELSKMFCRSLSHDHQIRNVSNNFLKSVDLFVDPNFVDPIHKSSDDRKRFELPKIVVSGSEKWIVVDDDVSSFWFAEDFDR
jgi:hypothetical protein